MYIYTYMYIYMYIYIYIYIYNMDCMFACPDLLDRQPPVVSLMYLKGSVLRCVAVCCGVLQCVAVCCGVLRCVAVVAMC